MSARILSARIKNTEFFFMEHSTKNVIRKCYITALFILGILGFSATAVMIYSYIHGFADIGNSAASIATGTGVGIIGVTQNFGGNYDPSSLTRTFVISNPDRDPFSGAITCTGSYIYRLVSIYCMN